MLHMFLTCSAISEKEIKPVWLRIGGYFYPRGGIPIDVFWQTDVPPKKVWIPDNNINIYNGRK